jgi:arylsulfatase A-like enzyme
MKRSFFARSISLFVVSLTIAFAQEPPARSQEVIQAPRKPNFLFILIDDLGWKDTACYGSTLYKTPNIDRLAAQGVRFMNAYTANPLCSPTRASIMTGMDPARLGITTPSCHVDQIVLKSTLPKTAPKWQKEIPPTVVTRLDTKFETYAKLLKKQGYVTGHFGKWHLGKEPYSPLQQGFDVDVPHWWGPCAGDYIAPWKIMNKAGVKFFDTPGRNIEDRMADEASAFIEKNKDKPFFVNYWAYSVHAPLDSTPSVIAHYLNRVHPEDLQRNPVYAAMVEVMDNAVGKLLDTIEKAGVADNTIVIFMSDNGGLTYNDPNVHKQFNGIPATTMAPLREGKGTIYEGGRRVPFIVRWPGKVKADTVSNALMVSTDLYPTILEMAGIRVPATQPLDGVSLVPVLTGNKSSVRKGVYCYLPQFQGPGRFPCASVRVGNWKMIRYFHGNADDSNREELYNLRDDIGETFNVIGSAPAIAKVLSADLDAYLKNINAILPVYPNPAYDPHANAAIWAPLGGRTSDPVEPFDDELLP